MRPTWRAAPAGAFDWRDWDGQTVVYVHASADTHALSPPASAVLAAMLEQPQDERTTAQWLERLGLPADDEADLDGVLQSLATTGVVVRGRPC